MHFDLSITRFSRINKQISQLRLKQLMKQINLNAFLKLKH